jgi:hypothetical protein
MKKLILASAAILGLNLSNAQTVNTEVQKGEATKTVGTKKAVPQSNEMRAERSANRMKAQLTLTEEQFKKVTLLKKNTYDGFKAAAEKNPGAENRDARVAAYKPLRDTYVASLKEILTEEQFTTYRANVTTRFENWKKTASAQPNAPKPDEEEQQIKLDIE